MISELLFRVQRTDDPSVAGELRIEIFAGVPGAVADNVGANVSDYKIAGVLHLPAPVAGVLRGAIDRFLPQLLPGVVLYWAGVPVESVPPFAGADKLLALARKLKLLPGA